MSRTAPSAPVWTLHNLYDVRIVLILAKLYMVGTAGFEPTTSTPCEGVAIGAG
jgi:hypothetical protein